MLKINGSNIASIKYNGSFIKQAKINGQTVFNKVVNTNLLNLSDSNWEWVNNSGEASATYDASDNSIYISYDATSSFGLNIKQNNLVLKAGKTYELSCDNIGSNTWISLDQISAIMLNKYETVKTYTPEADTPITQVMIWCDKNGDTYDNTKWNINLKEV